MEKISYNLVFNRKKRLNKKGMALVDGHGNFGSIEGDGAAAMRYTEARLLLRYTLNLNSGIRNVEW